VGAVSGGFLYKYKNPEKFIQIISYFKSDGTRAFLNPIVSENLFAMSKTVAQGTLFLPGSVFFITDMYQSGLMEATKNYFLPDSREILEYNEEEEIKKE
jgi:hypothetical protein